MQVGGRCGTGGREERTRWCDSPRRHAGVGVFRSGLYVGGGRSENGESGGASEEGGDCGVHDVPALRQAVEGRHHHLRVPPFV